MRKLIRLMTAVIVLATIPFAVVTLEKRISPRQIASSDSAMEYQRADNDLSESSPEEFKKAFKYQILKNISQELTSEGPSLSVGIFLIRNEAGQKIFACEKFKTIDFIYSADGMASSGEIPQMIVRGPCLVNSDHTRIEGLPVPLQKINLSPLSTTEFSSTIPGTEHSVKTYIRNVEGAWPTEWSWTGMKLYGDQGEVLSITGYEIISVQGEPVKLTNPKN